MDIKLIVTGSRPWEYWVRHWGLSFMIDNTILYDTFNNYPTLAKRLKKANVDIASLQDVVISHNHWDHIGGLWAFIEERPGVTVHLPASVTDSLRERIAAAGGRVAVKTGNQQIKENVHLSEDLLCAFDGDALAEQYISIHGANGLTLIVGCAHPGIVPIAQHAQRTFQKPVRRVIGGFHLFESNIEDARRCAKELKDMGVQMVAPTHCTGWRAERVFKRAFEQGFVALREGKIISL